MVKNFKSTFVNVHGSSLHSLIIFKVAYWLVINGFKIDPNPEVWSERMYYPGIPDVIATKYIKKDLKLKVVIREIESVYSRKTMRKKLMQFNTNFIDFDIIEINKLKKVINPKINSRTTLKKINELVDSWIDSVMAKCLD